MLLSNNISAIHIDSDNNKYIGTINGGLLTIIDTVWTLYTLQNSNLPDNTILDIDLDTSGNIWCIGPSAGLIVHAGGSTWLFYNSATSGCQTSSMNELLFDHSQNIWLASLDTGIIKKTGLSFTNYDSTNSGMPDHYVNCLALDIAGDYLWAGTLIGGAVKVDLSLLLSTYDFSVPDFKDVIVFPNPVKDVLNILSSKKIKAISVYDVSGKTIALQIQQRSPFISIETTSLPSGIYFLNLETEGNRISKKFIKE
jgi:ligand-binding sensor domain-containing protein